MGEWDGENPFDVTIAEEIEAFRIFCRTGKLPEQLEKILGEERYEAWVAIEEVRRKVFDDDVGEFLQQVSQKESDVGYAIVYMFRRFFELMT